MRDRILLLISLLDPASRVLKRSSDLFVRRPRKPVSSWPAASDFADRREVLTGWLVSTQSRKPAAKAARRIGHHVFTPGRLKYIRMDRECPVAAGTAHSKKS
jgi:hypothetical protein